MTLNSKNILPITVTAFFPWIIKVALLSLIMGFPHTLFVAAHYILIFLLFAAAFTLYFQSHKQQEPFMVMVVAMASMVVFELVYFLYFYSGTFWFLTYVDWIVPAFLIASVIHGTGVLVTKE